jgi:hypothetical protein
MVYERDTGQTGAGEDLEWFSSLVVPRPYELSDAPQKVDIVNVKRTDFLEAKGDELISQTIRKPVE